MGLAGCRGSNQISVLPPVGASVTKKIRSSPVYAGRTIKPLKKLDVSSQSACSLGQDRGPPARRKTPARTPAKSDEFSLPFRATLTDVPERNDLLSNSVYGVRTRTCQRQPARPEDGYLAGLLCLAKSKIQTSLRPAPGDEKLGIRCHMARPRLV